MYQTLLENSLMGLTIMQNERFVFVNQQAQKIFGYSREEFLSFDLNQIVDLVHPEDRTNVVTMSQGTRIRVKRKDGTYAQVISHVKLISYRDMPALHQAFIEL
jgi:PAS domain S-box-containing protein